MEFRASIVVNKEFLKAASVSFLGDSAGKLAKTLIWSLLEAKPKKLLDTIVDVFSLELEICKGNQTYGQLSLINL